MKPMMEIANMLTKFMSKHTRGKPQGQRSILLFAGLIGCLFLSSCTGSTYSSHFDCPMGEGAGCASISRVNKMIDRQEIDLVEGRLPVEGQLPGNDDTPACRGVCPNQLPGNQVYVYYGPDQLSRLIPTEELKSPTAIEGN